MLLLLLLLLLLLMLMKLVEVMVKKRLGLLLCSHVMHGIDMVHVMMMMACGIIHHRRVHAVACK